MENDKNIQEAAQELQNFINELQERYKVVVLTLPKFQPASEGAGFNIGTYISIVNQKEREEVVKEEATTETKEEATTETKEDTTVEDTTVEDTTVEDTTVEDTTVEDTTVEDTTVETKEDTTTE